MTSLLLAQNYWLISIAFIIIGIVVFLISVHYNKKYPNVTLPMLFLIDQKTGLPSDSKVRLNLAFVISSWGFIYLILHNTLTEWFFWGYLGAWVTDRFLARWNSQKTAKEE